MRLMTDGEICRNFRTTVGSDASKIKRLRELNPDLTKDDIVGILQRDGVSVNVKGKRHNPKATTRAQREQWRAEEEERMKVPKKRRETRKQWADRIGVSVDYLSKVITTTEEDWGEDE